MNINMYTCNEELSGSFVINYQNDNNDVLKLKSIE